jgi:membrane-associated phospholipid phosphatase
MPIRPASSRIPAVIAAWALAFSAMVPSARPADGRQQPDPFRFVTWPVQDVTGLIAGVSYRELIGAAGFGLVTLAASRFDRPVTERAARIPDGGPIRVVREFGDVRVVLPLGVVVFTGALLSGDDRFQDAAFTSLEAVVFAITVTGLVKVATGRARPYRELGPGSFEPFSGRHSFPSGHSATAFALLTPWFLYYPGPATAGLLALAGATAFSRMVTNRHWLSDVMVGSAIGSATAYALTRRHVRVGGVRVTPGIAANAILIDVRF